MKIQKRNPFFDNAKFLLMVFVVFGHLIQSFIEDRSFNYDLYLFIYSFHMPAFIFISGYFAGSFTRKDNQIRSNFCKLIIPYIIFQWGYALYYYLLGITDTFSFGLLIPNWSLWFLLSLFFWQMSLYLFSKMPPAVGIGISILGSVLIGYFPFISNELTIQRTFVFLPFFIMGYYLKEDGIQIIYQSKWRKWLPIGLIIVFLTIRYGYDIDKYLFFGSMPYEDFLDFPKVGVFVRLFSLMLGVLGTVSFLSLVPVNHKFFTKYGENTLVVYLFHGFFIRALRAQGLEQYDLSIVGLFALLVGSFILTILLASKPVAKFYNKLANWCLKKS